MVPEAKLFGVEAAVTPKDETPRNSVTNSVGEDKATEKERAALRARMKFLQGNLAHLRMQAQNKKVMDEWREKERIEKERIRAENEKKRAEMEAILKLNELGRKGLIPCLFKGENATDPRICSLTSTTPASRDSQARTVVYHDTGIQTLPPRTASIWESVYGVECEQEQGGNMSRGRWLPNQRHPCDLYYGEPYVATTAENPVRTTDSGFNTMGIQETQKRIHEAKLSAASQGSQIKDIKNRSVRLSVERRDRMIVHSAQHHVSTTLEDGSKIGTMPLRNLVYTIVKRPVSKLKKKLDKKNAREKADAAAMSPAKGSSKKEKADGPVAATAEESSQRDQVNASAPTATNGSTDQNSAGTPALTTVEDFKEQNPTDAPAPITVKEFTDQNAADASSLDSSQGGAEKKQSNSLDETEDETVLHKKIATFQIEIAALRAAIDVNKKKQAAAAIKEAAKTLVQDPTDPNVPEYLRNLYEKVANNVSKLSVLQGVNIVTTTADAPTNDTAGTNPAALTAAIAQAPASSKRGKDEPFTNSAAISALRKKVAEFHARDSAQVPATEAEKSAVAPTQAHPQQKQDESTAEATRAHPQTKQTDYPVEATTKAPAKQKRADSLVDTTIQAPTQKLKGIRIYLEAPTREVTGHREFGNPRIVIADELEEDADKFRADLKHSRKFLPSELNSGAYATHVSAFLVPIRGHPHSRASFTQLRATSQVVFISEIAGRKRKTAHGADNLQEKNKISEFFRKTTINEPLRSPKRVKREQAAREKRRLEEKWNAELEKFQAELDEVWEAELRKVEAEEADERRQENERKMKEMRESVRASIKKAQADKAQAEKTQAENAQAEKIQAERALEEKAQAEKAQAEKPHAEKLQREEEERRMNEKTRALIKQALPKKAQALELKVEVENPKESLDPLGASSRKRKADDDVTERKENIQSNSCKDSKDADSHQGAKRIRMADEDSEKEDAQKSTQVKMDKLRNGQSKSLPGVGKQIPTIAGSHQAGESTLSVKLPAGGAAFTRDRPRFGPPKKNPITESTSQAIEVSKAAQKSATDSTGQTVEDSKVAQTQPEPGPQVSPTGVNAPTAPSAMRTQQPNRTTEIFNQTANLARKRGRSEEAPPQLVGHQIRAFQGLPLCGRAKKRKHRRHSDTRTTVPLYQPGPARHGDVDLGRFESFASFENQSRNDDKAHEDRRKRQRRS